MISKAWLGGSIVRRGAHIGNGLGAIRRSFTSLPENGRRNFSIKQPLRQPAEGTETSPRISHGQLNTHLPGKQSFDSSRGTTLNYNASISKIMELRKTYLQDRYIYVESDSMIAILKGLGATDEDLIFIQTVSDNLPPDPTLPFRESKNGRFCFDSEGKNIRRLEFQPFALSVTEDFKRHDSDQIRHFAEIENDLQLNTVFQALLLFKNMILHQVPISPRPHLDYADSRWICTVFNLRTVTTPEILGEPALEGVHTDGVDHTMTTFLGSANMGARSCVTALHSNGEETGIAHSQTRPEHCLAKVQHRNLLDTLVIADNERKHSLSPLVPEDPGKRATRDMLIFFTRKPATKGHVSEHIDSKDSHRKLAMEIPLQLPSWR